METFDLKNFCQRLEGMDRVTIGMMIEREIEQLDRENIASTKESGENSLIQTSYGDSIKSLSKLLNLVKNRQAITATPDEALIFNRVIKSEVEDELSDH